jgi:iron complex transport system permease protein
MFSSKRAYWFLSVVILTILFLSNLFYGTVSIPVSAVMDILLGKGHESTAWVHIVLQSRLPQAVTALLAGAALAVGGLLLQTLFRNPLAGPDILGISNGANLGVAIILLSTGGIVGNGFSTISAAFVGALVVLGLIIYFSSIVKSNILILIIGLMVGYLASSGISFLNAVAGSERIRSYVLWGLGSFSNVTTVQLPVFCICLLTGLAAAVLLMKPLNALLLGEHYASNLGINIFRTRIAILLITGFLTAVVTAYCGPIAFVGLAAPHLSRMVLGSSEQKQLLPATILAGAAIALVCNVLTSLPFGNGLLPLNAVTPLLGAPVIIYVILNRKNHLYFN